MPYHNNANGWEGVIEQAKGPGNKMTVGANLFYLDEYGNLNGTSVIWDTATNSVKGADTVSPPSCETCRTNKRFTTWFSDGTGVMNRAGEAV